MFCVQYAQNIVSFFGEIRVKFTINSRNSNKSML